MTPLEKVRAWMADDPRIKQKAIAEAAGSSVSSVNDWLNDKSGLTDLARHAGIVRRMRADFPGVDLDWYADESTAWPPPAPPIPADPAAPRLTEHERRVLVIAHELCGDDPTLRLARERLLGIATAPIPMTIVPASAGIAEYEADKARRDREAGAEGGANHVPPRVRRPNSGA